MTEQLDFSFHSAGDPLPAGAAADGDGPPPPPPAGWPAPVPILPPSWWAEPDILARELSEILACVTLDVEVSALLMTDQYAAALPLLDELLAINPVHFGSLLNKSLCLLEQQDYRAALRVLQAAEALEPLDANLLADKREALLELGEYGQAEQVLGQLLALEPADCFLHYDLAACAAQLGKPRKALRELRLIAASFPSLLREAAADPAFARLRRLPAFRKLLAANKRRS